MAKILNINELLNVAIELKLPEADSLVRAAESVAHLAGMAIASHLEIDHDDAEHVPGFGGTCVVFLPRHEGQVCPAIIHDCDPSGEFTLTVST